MVLAEFSIFPLDKGVSLSSYVARILDIVDKSDLAYKFGPMGTCVEGEWNDVMSLVKECFESLRPDCDRIECSVKIDYRKGAGGRLDGKVKSVERKIGRELMK